MLRRVLTRRRGAVAHAAYTRGMTILEVAAGARAAEMPAVTIPRLRRTRAAALVALKLALGVIVTLVIGALMSPVTP